MKSKQPTIQVSEPEINGNEILRFLLVNRWFSVTHWEIVEGAYFTASADRTMHALFNIPPPVKSSTVKEFYF